jgi:transcriptional regulator
MYPLEPFRSADEEKMREVMRAFPLATLITQGASWPVVTQVPLILEPNRGTAGFLLGHFDANNPHADAMRKDPHVLCLFQGPNHYVTPSIYPTEQYPGWNYVAVHVRAIAHLLEDRERVRTILFRLTELHEPASSGYALRSTQKNFDRFLGMIFGFELEIVEARAIFKLAQDKGAHHAELAATWLAQKHAEANVLPLLRRLLAP